MVTEVRPLDTTSLPSDAPTDPVEADVAATEAWFGTDRFRDTTRLHTARDVVEQRGAFPPEHALTARTASAFHRRLRQAFAAGRQLTTFGPYSPGQAVTMKRQGIEAIYLGGWATSARGSVTEDPGPDLASYPLSAVPEEGAAIVRALRVADRNQHFARARLTSAERAATAAIDYRPFIIADADTGHGGEAHVRNVIRRFVEAGVPGYHIEDQRPGAKKCGHQDGKVLVAQYEQHLRLNAARLQLDVMGVPGLIVARTDAEAATLLDDISDERDQPFVLGATNPDVPPFRIVFVAALRRLAELGVDDVRGQHLFAIPPATLAEAERWLDDAGLGASIDAVAAHALATTPRPATDTIVGTVEAQVTEAWAAAARLATLPDAVAALVDGPLPADCSIVGLRRHAAEHGRAVAWDPEAVRTADGYYRIRGGLELAIARSIAAAPFADLLWMETAVADLDVARRYAEAVHAVHPDAMLAYNLSPSFNWDTTGMTDDEMRRFPAELGRLGFVFGFITYGGHQIDGLAAEEFAAALRIDGTLALARLQRRLRLLESPYRGPQALVGGDRVDAALLASSGRIASTKAMGAASTHRQHLTATELPLSVLTDRLASAGHDGLGARLRPTAPWSDRTDLVVADRTGEPCLRITWLASEGPAGRALVIEHEAAATDIDPAIVGLAVDYLVERVGAVEVRRLWPVSERVPLA
jgi:isocitrate lyase